MNTVLKLVDFQDELPGLQRSDSELLRAEIEILKEQTANVRRGLFARHTELANLFLQQQQEIDALKEKLKNCKVN